MTERTASEVQGYEFDWLALDAEGNVALFSTAGGGYTPAAFLRDTDAHDAAIDAILGTQSVTDVRFAPELAPDLENTWREVAARGLFAFDSDFNGGPYRLVAAPDVPVTVEELPPLVGRVLTHGPVFKRVRFPETSVVTTLQLRQDLDDIDE